MTVHIVSDALGDAIDAYNEAVSHEMRCRDMRTKAKLHAEACEKEYAEAQRARYDAGDQVLFIAGNHGGRE